NPEHWELEEPIALGHHCVWFRSGPAAVAVFLSGIGPRIAAHALCRDILFSARLRLSSFRFAGTPFRDPLNYRISFSKSRSYEWPPPLHLDASATSSKKAPKPIRSG